MQLRAASWQIWQGTVRPSAAPFCAQADMEEGKGCKFCTIHGGGLASNVCVFVFGCCWPCVTGQSAKGRTVRLDFVASSLLEHCWFLIAVSKLNHRSFETRLANSLERLNRAEPLVAKHSSIRLLRRRLLLPLLVAPLRSHHRHLCRTERQRRRQPDDASGCQDTAACIFKHDRFLQISDRYQYMSAIPLEAGGGCVMAGTVMSTTTGYSHHGRRKADNVQPIRVDVTASCCCI